MICKHPYMIGSQPVPCGGSHKTVEGKRIKCLPCLINRQRMWTNRLLLESKCHEDACFITLTYDEENLPKDNSLNKKDYQNWLKRFRREIEPHRIRYFIAGEYGEREKRPHYHGILFGIDPITAGGLDGCSGIINKTWGKGFTFVGDFTVESAQYVAGYVTKKLTSEEIGEKTKEFTRMSLKPYGIGAGAIKPIQQAILHAERVNYDTRVDGDVPTSIKHGSRTLPLGRYLRNKIRGSNDVPEATKKIQAIKMRIMLEEALKDKENTSKSVGKIIIDNNAQKVRNIEARFKIKRRITL